MNSARQKGKCKQDVCYEAGYLRQLTKVNSLKGKGLRGLKYFSIDINALRAKRNEL